MVVRLIIKTSGLHLYEVRQNLEIHFIGHSSNVPYIFYNNHVLDLERHSDK